MYAKLNVIELAEFTVDGAALRRESWELAWTLNSETCHNKYKLYTYLNKS